MTVIRPALSLTKRCAVSDLPEAFCADCRHDTHGAAGRELVDPEQFAGDPWSTPSGTVETGSEGVIIAEHETECVACLTKIRPGHHLYRNPEGDWVHLLCPVPTS